MEYNERANENDFQRKENINSAESSSKEPNEESTFHIEELESDVVDPNSKFMELADSFQVLKDGEKISPDDLHPEDGDKVKSQKHDKHPLTHLQKVEFGLESEKEDEGHGPASKRAFTVYNSLWPKGIVPYEINTTSLTDPRAVPVIEEAINILSSTTCVQFLPHTPELETKVGHTNYINFFSGSGCWSYVGMVAKKQSLSLLQSGCLGVGIALHEMLHALGQWHEQSRTDRDYHVNLKWDILGTNEQGGANYGKFPTRDYWPYDYESVMQYGASNGMEVLQPELTFLTYSGNGLSFYDIAEITTAYRCTEKCINPPKCQNGGFLNFKCECLCPNGLTGLTCESVETEVCGGIINLIAGQEVTITSPNFPKSYETNTKCVWLIRAPKDLRVRVDVDVFHLPVVDSNNRCYHWLEVRYNLVGQTGIRKCGTTSGDTWITSQWGEQNLMLLIFDSVFGKQHNAEKGFSLRARTVDKGCIPNPCIKGVCKDCDDGTFKCVCDPGFEGKLCDTMEASTTFECTFESTRSNTCFMRNVQGDDFDWIVYSGQTVSELTGPDEAHSGENYIYAEGSSPRKLNDKAVLETDLNFPAGDYCLTFYYSMFGADMGSLSAVVKDSKAERLLWTKSGNQGFNWIQGRVEISIVENSKVRFEAKRGSNWESDIALDDIKISPGLCAAEKPNPLNCMATIKGTDYIGTIQTTSGGHTCQRWDSNSPHQHSYHDYDNNENYCRNTRGDEERPWCYTTNPDTRWDYCTVPHCDVEECLRSKTGYEYMGSKNVTAMGKTCATGSDGTNTCRAGANDPAPWCYTVDANIRWDTCVIPRCTTKPKDCLKTAKGIDYFGMVNKTKSGKTCQAWATQEPHPHEFWAMADQGNYCRNPNGESAPWCYTTDPDIKYELCDIPFCEVLKCLSNPCLHGGRCEEVSGGYKCTCQLGYAGTTCETRVRNVEDCKRSKVGYEYNGMINTTVSNRTCQRWALDTPQSHNYNNVDGENYCRNPDKEPYGPWCYTTDPNKRWEYCNIPYCSTPAKECIQSDKGGEYFGSVRRTKGGIPCQKWADQIPHSHRYGYIADQDDYCRNPYNEEVFPWCYTVDPDVRWEYCDIPRC